MSFLDGASGKEPACQSRRRKRLGFEPWIWKSPGGGNGNPLQYSRLENSLDRGAWWATVNRVAHSQTTLQRLSTHARTVLSVQLNVIMLDACASVCMR